MSLHQENHEFQKVVQEQRSAQELLKKVQELRQEVMAQPGLGCLG